MTLKNPILKEVASPKEAFKMSKAKGILWSLHIMHGLRWKAWTAKREAIKAKHPIARHPMNQRLKKTRLVISIRATNGLQLVLCAFKGFFQL